MMHNTRDLSGERFGNLVAVRPTSERKSGSVVWECQCDCGNTTLASAQNLRRGDKKSCGCILETDLTGFSFGEFVVTGFSHSDGRRKYWRCECSCGETVLMDTYTIHSGKKVHCRSHAHINPLTIDLTGQRFGRLTVVEKMPYNDKFNRILWRCKCDCGNEKIVMGAYLRTGAVSSCGCLVSKGELAVEQWLESHNIEKDTQYKFDDLFGDKDYLRFDFAIFHNGELRGLIEIQGPQHWLESNDWHTDTLVRYDAKKKLYCAQHNIPLLEVPYDHGDLDMSSVEQFINMILKEESN